MGVRMMCPLSSIERKTPPRESGSAQAAEQTMESVDLLAG